MHDETEAIVEIWLKQGGLKDDKCIKRVINKNSNSSQWYIDGKHVTEKEVLAVVKKHTIKLDNMCHFLPQEKVKGFAEFAGKPEKFLLEVESAVGPAWMRPLHEELIEEQANRHNLMQMQEAQNKELSSLRSKEERLRDEMTRFDQINALAKEVAIREKKLPWCKVIPEIHSYFE